MLTVVAALIESDGKVLVCQRRRGSRFGLLWEFPGGKAEPGETLEQALGRELREELGVYARIGREIYRTQHEYTEMPQAIELVFFAARISAGEPTNLDFEQIAWREPASLPELNFLPADRELIEKLATGSLGLP
jgi:8-oxo-dGTP diphosphatase